jgi:hypothetical protein
LRAGPDDGQSDEEIIDTVIDQYLEYVAGNPRPWLEPRHHLSSRVEIALALLAGYHNGRSWATAR